MLRDLEVLILDCQASGATPAWGDLLEIGWTVCGPGGPHPIESHWIVPKTDRRISAPVRKLLGWSEACVADAIPAEEAWTKLSLRMTPNMPALIHWARFEIPFLRELAGGEPALSIKCLHAIAERLFDGLPKKNIRALAGHLGHSASHLRRASGHVEATAFIWERVVPRLEAEGIASWDDLGEWLARPFTKNKAIVFPYPPEKRKALTGSPGVYRFLRSNGDVIYVGKAASIKKRIASHFQAKRGKNDALEMLTQVADVQVTETETALEAALLEVEEIQRLDPPYNVQLRSAERSAWFATRDFDHVQNAPDSEHVVGPLPSAGAVSGLAAMRKILLGAAPDDRLRAATVGVPTAFAPDLDMWTDAWNALALKAPLLDAALALHPLREEEHEEEDGWNPARVLRYLTRTLVGEGLVVRRARLLCLLADARIHFVDGGRARSLGEHRRPRSLRVRKAAFDARSYDRFRVMATELRRVHLEGGDVRVAVGEHALPAALVAKVFAGL